MAAGQYLPTANNITVIEGVKNVLPELHISAQELHLSILFPIKLINSLHAKQ